MIIKSLLKKLSWETRGERVLKVYDSSGSKTLYHIDMGETNIEDMDDEMLNLNIYDWYIDEDLVEVWIV